MASGSQNMTTYLAKGLEKVLTTNATNTDSLLYINTADTNITADMLGATTSIAFTRMSTTGAYTTGHIVWLNAADIGTPFQLVVHDSSDLYLYKRWKSSGTWTDWVKMCAGTADTWTTARTLTIGNTGKSVDGSANVSWSKDEILGASTNAYFLRGDKAWSNTLNGAFTANGTITANGGYLKSTANSNTVTIGSQNADYTHIYNSASIPFIFNNTVESTSGDLGSTSYPWHNLYIGKSDGAGIYYKGTKNTYRMIRFIDNASDIYGNGISIGGGGLAVFGAGESADTILSNLNLTAAGGTETTYIGSDDSIEFYPSINSWDASARIWMTAGVLNIGVDGNTTRENSLNVYSGAGRIQLYSAASTTGNRGLWVPAHGSGSSKNIIVIDTNNNASFNGNAASSTRLETNTSTVSSDPGGLTWFNISAASSTTVNTNDTPSSSDTWWYILRNRHTNTSNNYYTDLAIPFNATGMYYKRIQNNAITNGWVQILSGDMDFSFLDSGTTTRSIRFVVGTNDYARLAAGATATNSGWMELATADDGNEPIYVRQYTGVFTTIKRTLTLLDANGDTTVPGGLGVANTSATSGLGISLYGGGKNTIPEYGIIFGGTATFGKFGDVSSDWATYFTMNRSDTRGWIFKSNGTTANGNNNYASISGRGHFTGSLTPSSWLDGQRYTNAAYNIADYSNTGSYNPWMRATNTWSSGAENAKVGRWFSFGTLGTSFYWIGSTTSRTTNSYDYGMTYNISNGVLTSTRMDCSWLRVINNSSNNDDDAMVYIESKTTSDWAVKINKGGNRYGVYIDSLDQDDALRTNGYIRGRAIWANQGSNGERQVGVDSGTSGNLYFYANTSGKGIYSGSGYQTGSVITINSSEKRFYGNVTGNVTGNCSGSSGSCTGNAANVTGTVAIGHGGTGATTAANARNNLGLGSIATYGAATAGTKDTWGLVPVIGASDGVMEIGKYIDFHVTDGNTKDYDVRITADTAGLTLGGTTSGTFKGNITGNVTGNCSGSSGSCTGNAATATNADKVDNYHASSLWRSDGGTWNGNANIACTPTAANQEYSFDLGNAYTGTYWHVWSGKNSKSILMCYNDNMNVSVPNGTLTAKAFSGPLTGNVTGNCSGSSGSCTGNAATATKATQDGDGNTIKSTYLKLSGGVMTGQIEFNNKGSCRIYNGANDAANGAGGALNNLVISSWYGVSFTTDCANTTYTKTNAVSINCRNGNVYAARFNGPLTGDVTGNCSGSSGSCTGNAATATTATKLGTANKGDANHPIYLSGGTPYQCNYPHSGAWYSAVPYIHSDGMMEIGRYIDFHGTSNTTADHTIRLTCATNTARIDCNGIFTATGWSDLAEYRRTIEHEPGRAIIPTDNGIAKRATGRLQPGARIVSDTYGFCLGESDDEQSPIALTGRVLAYPCRPISEYHAGDAVCSGPNGTVDLMTREEIQKYPDCIVGIVNEIPTYPIWNPKHTDDRQKVVFNENVEVRGRIWIDVK